MESDYVLPGQMILPPVKTPVGNLGLSVVSFSYMIAVPRQAVFCAWTSETGYEKNYCVMFVHIVTLYYCFLCICCF
jgi:hypothetical protein